MKIVTIDAPVTDGTGSMKISGYRFAAWIGQYQHWFLVDHDGPRISHYDSGMLVGVLSIVSDPKTQVQNAKEHLKSLVKRAGSAKVHAVLSAAPPRVRAVR